MAVWLTWCDPQPARLPGRVRNIPAARSQPQLSQAVWNRLLARGAGRGLLCGWQNRDRNHTPDTRRRGSARYPQLLAQDKPVGADHLERIAYAAPRKSENRSQRKTRAAT